MGTAGGAILVSVFALGISIASIFVSVLLATRREKYEAKRLTLALKGDSYRRIMETTWPLMHSRPSTVAEYERLWTGLRALAVEVSIPFGCLTEDEQLGDL